MPKLSAGQIAGVVKYEGSGAGAGFQYSLYNPDTDGPIFVAIALVESGGDTDITHKNNDEWKSTDKGLWQINDHWHADLLEANKPWQNPNNNFHMAVALYHNRNGKFTDWTTWKTGLYATRMAEAQTAWNNPDMSQTDPNAIGDAFNAAGEAVTSTADLISALTKASTWIRVGMGAAGVLILALVVAGMMRTKLPGPLGMVARAAKEAKVPAAVTEGIPA